MKLKLLIQRQDDLSGIVSCIDWTGSNEIFSIGYAIFDFKLKKCSIQILSNIVAKIYINGM